MRFDSDRGKGAVGICLVPGQFGGNAAKTPSVKCLSVVVFTDYESPILCLQTQYPFFSLCSFTDCVHSTSS